MSWDHLTQSHELRTTQAVKHFLCLQTKQSQRDYDNCEHTTTHFRSVNGEVLETVCD